jgi:hypothetical protein
MAIRAKNHIAATSAIATVRSAFGHKFLPSKTDAPASAFTGLCKNFYPIDEHPANSELLKGYNVKTGVVQPFNNSPA